MSLARLPLPLAGSRVRLEANSAGAIVIGRLADLLPVGSASLLADGTTLTIERLCIDATARGYGCGSEAAQLILAAAAPRYRTVRAWAPPDLGLAVYFWSRMGLRPLFSDCPEGCLRFVRELTGPRR